MYTHNESRNKRIHESRKMFAIRIVFVFGAVIFLASNASARAVNISNTWMLPEEGFPVFYRYFRDRISWNEADAVCQFHHANLVTVDSTSQYDAIRAYLKELDIASNVWIGLSRTSDKPNFTWSEFPVLYNCVFAMWRRSKNLDFRDLSAPDYWQEAIPSGSEPLCAAMDPAADFRWHALACGGPEVAAFICELPVPSWASQPTAGCLITELPSLTVLYIPEQSAVELTSDCGLGGTKRIVCKGNTDRDEMVRQLACSNGVMLEDKTQSAITTQQEQLRQQQTSSTSVSSVSTGTTSTSTETPTTSISSTSASSIPHASVNIVSMMNPTITTLTPIAAAAAAAIAVGLSAPTTNTPDNNGGTPGAKTTKPWNWTSNTIDTGDYSLPTRHRRETEEDTLIPLSARSTTELPKLPNTSAGAEDEPEMTTATAEVKTEAEEYASAINQGQLFSIIMNGTMFDIIEFNDTEENKTLTHDPKLTSSVTETLAQKKSEEVTTVTYNKEPTDGVDTPVTSHKNEAASGKYIKEVMPEFSGNLNAPKLHRTFRKQVPGDENSLAFDKLDGGLEIDVDNDLKAQKNAIVNGGEESNLRKETPTQNTPADGTTVADVIDAKPQAAAKGKVGKGGKTVDKTGKSKPYHLVEIRLQETGGNRVKPTLFVTTKRADKNANAAAPPPLALETNENRSKTDANKLPITNSTPSSAAVKSADKSPATSTTTTITATSPPAVSETTEAEVQTSGANAAAASLTKMDADSEEDVEHVKQLLEHVANGQMGGETSTATTASVKVAAATEGSDFDSEPTLKPNRQRQLTRSNRRSFYPYFFSRVLG